MFRMSTFSFPLVEKSSSRERVFLTYLLYMALATFGCMLAVPTSMLAYTSFNVDVEYTYGTATTSRDWVFSSDFTDDQICSLFGGCDTIKTFAVVAGVGTCADVATSTAKWTKNITLRPEINRDVRLNHVEGYDYLFSGYTGVMYQAILFDQAYSTSTGYCVETDVVYGIPDYFYNYSYSYIDISSPVNGTTTSSTTVPIVVSLNNFNSSYDVFVTLREFGGLNRVYSTSTSITLVGSTDIVFDYTLFATTTWSVTAYSEDMVGERLYASSTFHVLAPSSLYLAYTEGYDDIPCSITDLTGCFKKSMYWLFVPNAYDTQVLITDLVNGLTTTFPFSFFMRVLTLLTDGNEVEFPALSYTFGTAVPAELTGKTFSINPLDNFDALNSLESDVTGQSIWEIIDPYVTTFLALSLGLIIITDIFGLVFRSEVSPIVQKDEFEQGIQQRDLSYRQQVQYRKRFPDRFSKLPARRTML